MSDHDDWGESRYEILSGPQKSTRVKHTPRSCLVSNAHDPFVQYDVPNQALYADHVAILRRTDGYLDGSNGPFTSAEFDARLALDEAFNELGAPEREENDKLIDYGYRRSRREDFVRRANSQLPFWSQIDPARMQKQNELDELARINPKAEKAIRDIEALDKINLWPEFGRLP